MKKLSPNIAEFTEVELVILEVHNLLMDQGHDPNEAVNIIFGTAVHPGLRSPTPMLDDVLTPAFLAWLRSSTDRVKEATP